MKFVSIPRVNAVLLWYNKDIRGNNPLELSAPTRFDNLGLENEWGRHRRVKRLRMGARQL